MARNLSVSLDDVLTILQAGPRQNLAATTTKGALAELRVHIRYQLSVVDTIARYANESDSAPPKLVEWRSMSTSSLEDYKELSDMTEAEWHALEVSDLAHLAIMLNKAYNRLVLMLM